MIIDNLTARHVRQTLFVFCSLFLRLFFSDAVLAHERWILSPEQIQEFNSQPIAPIETPAGPVYMDPPPVNQKPKAPFDSRYVKNPDGEEQAEAQEVESAAPFEPIPATFTF
mgnify:CR=1 FL=1